MKFEADFGLVYFFSLFFSPPPPIFSYRSREERSRQKTTARSNYFSFRLDVEKRNRSGVFPLVVFFREIFRLKRVKGNHAENQYDRILHSSRSFGLFVSNTRRKTIAEWLYDRVLQSSYFCFLFFFSDIVISNVRRKGILHIFIDNFHCSWIKTKTECRAQTTSPDQIRSRSSFMF